MQGDIEINSLSTSPQRVNAGVHHEAAGTKYFCRVVAVPVVGVIVEAQVEAQALRVQTPTFDVGSVDGESRRALKVTERSEIGEDSSASKLFSTHKTYLLSSMTFRNSGTSCRNWN